MLKKTLAALALASNLVACHDVRPQVIEVRTPIDRPSDHPGTMTVQGQASLEVSPDCADLTITIADESLRPGTATKDLETKKQALLAGFGKVGVEAHDVKVSALTLDPVFELTAQGYPTAKVRTYRAELTVTATTRDFTKIPDMLDAAGNAGATAMSTQFRRSDLPELKKKVRDMALAAAKDKALQTTKALGIKLGRITSVAENQGGYMWNATYFPQAANSMATQNNAGAVALGGAMQPLTLDVSISFELGSET